MNFRKVNVHLILLVTLAVAIIAIINSSAVVNADSGNSVNATVTVTRGGGIVSDGGGAGGGGGGGGGGITSVYDAVTGNGRFLSDVTAKSEDRNVILYIPKDTIGLNQNGHPLISITIKEKVPAPTLPEDAEIIGLAYEITPSGSTFSPPATFTIVYDEDEIPLGVAEKNLVIAEYDSKSEQWRNLKCTVDVENNTVTTGLDIFSTYSILAYTRPASFGVTDFSINPEEASVGEEISIDFLITNTGDLTGSYEVVLKINGTAMRTSVLTLDGGASQRISFTVTRTIAGEYTISIDNLSGRLVVKKPVSEGVVAEVPAPEPPATELPEPAPEPVTVQEPELRIPFTLPELPEVGEGSNWQPIIMLYVGILVLIGVLVYLYRRYG